MVDYVRSDDVERRAREIAREMRLAHGDEQIERIADRDAERLAILETEMRYIKRAVDEMARDVSEMKTFVTKAGGIKLAMLSMGAFVAFFISQVWHLFDAWRR